MITIALPFLAGLAAGAIYWPLLWLTVRRLPYAHHAGVLLALSALVRIGLVVLVFYVVMDGEALRLLACVAGFIAMRIVLTILVGFGDGRRGHTA